MEVVALNESLEEQVQELNEKVETRDLVIESQKKALLELAEKLDDVTNGQISKDIEGLEEEEKEKQVINPFFKGREISNIEEDANNESSYS